MALMTGAAIVVGLAVVLAIALTQRGVPGASAPVTSDNPFGLATPSHSTPADLAQGNALGSANAPVLIEVYEDYQCPVCATFVNTELGRLVADVVRPGLARIVNHDIAILGGQGSGDESIAAATAARCALDQDRYWAFHDWIYANQAGENKGGFAADRLRAIALAAGLDATAYDSCLAAGTQRAAVISSTQQAVAQGYTQTPTLVINGRKFVGLPDYDSLLGYLRGLAPSAAPSGSPAPSGSAASS